MSAHRRAEPARVLEPDVGEHARPARRARWWRRSARRGRPRRPRPRRSRRASSANAAAVSELELRHAVAGLERAVDLRRRHGGALHGGAEGVGRRGRRRRSGSARRSVVRCGDRNAPVRTPWASSSAALMRTVEDLPFVPTTWIARERAPAGCRARSAAGACAPARSASRTARARGGGPRRRSRRHGAVTQSSSSSCLQPLELRRARPRRRPRGRLGDEALVRELALGARDLLLAAVARSARARAGRGLEVDRLGREHRDAAAGDADGRDRLAAVGRPLDAREPRDVVGRALVALRRPAARGTSCPAAAPTRSRQPRSSCVGVDRPRDLAPRRPRRAARRRPPGSGGPSAGRPRPGR